MTLPRAILFDFDGTLIDSAADIARSANAALVALGHEPIPEAQVRSFIGDGLDTLMRRCLGGIDAELEPALAAFRSHYREHLVVDTVPYEGIPELLDELVVYPLGLVSNKSEAYCREILRHLGWADRFGSVVGADSVPEKKPAPDMILRAVEDLGVSPGEALLIGDGTTDVLAGLAAGVPTWAVGWGYKAIDALRQAGATTILASVAELRTRLRLELAS